MHSALMLITRMPPRAVWAMRADEACRMVEARSKLNQRRRAAPQKGSGEKPDVETIDLGNGRKEMRFHTVAGLRQLLQKPRT
jgi:hypothetical protein